MFMNQKEEDFKYLVEHACLTLSLSHQAVKEKYTVLPVCYMQYRKDGISSDSVEVSFDRIGASITFDISQENICFHASIHFYNTKDENLFIGYLSQSADYNYIKKGWVVDGSFFVELEEQHNGLHFYCYKKEK